MGNKLGQIVKSHPEALEDRGLLNSLLSGAFPEDKLTRNTILMAFDEGIPGQFNGRSSIEEADLHRCVRALMEGYGISEDLAERAVRTWMYALDVSIEEAGESPREQAPSQGENGSSYDYNEAQLLETFKFQEVVGGFEVTRYIGFNDEEVTVPGKVFGKNVVRIGPGAFQGCPNIKKVTISNGIEELGEKAFYGCTGLKEIVLPDSLRIIGVWGFTSSGVKSIRIPDSVVVMRGRVFSNCRALTSVVCPAGLNVISSYMFEGDLNLQMVQLPEALQEIGDEAFHGCRSLKELYFPDGLMKIGADAFSHCWGLSELYFPDGLREIGKDALDIYQDKYHARSNPIIPPSPLSVVKFHIPDSVEKIDPKAFGGDAVGDRKLYTIYCSGGSYAQQYAREHGFTCIKEK